MADSEERLTKPLGMHRSGDMDCRHTGKTWYALLLGQSHREVMNDDVALGKLWAVVHPLDLRLFSVCVGRDDAVSMRVDIDVEQFHWKDAERIAVEAAFLEARWPGSLKDSLESRNVVL